MTPWMSSACTVWIVLLSWPVVEASIGDNLHTYVYCLSNCAQKICSPGQDLYKGGVVNKFLQWTCQDECRYSCMWHTVEILERQSLAIPQFYGKWPFIRVLFMQEVASVLFSAFNLLSQVYALVEFCKKVGKSNLYTRLWQLYGLVNINTWIWSMAFHCRDLPPTEMLDYISAFGVVMFFLVILAYRSMNQWPPSFNIFSGICLLFYFNHASYIILYKFDYGYNMKVNIFVGSIAAFGWLIWCWTHRHLPHVHYMTTFVLLTCSTTTLELLDFQPILWLFDAHAIWHLSTAPLQILLFRFAIADCNYFVKTKERIY